MAAKLLSQVVDFYQKRYREMSGVPQGDGTPIEQMIPALIALPPEVYGAYAFRRDPIQGRFDRQQRKELIARALACGREQAEEYRRRFGALRPSEIARRLGLKLDSPSIPEGGGRVLFAQFTEPDRISVYQDCLDRAAETIRRHHLASLLGHAELREVLIAHELFHELEYREGERLFTRSYRVRLWKLGPFVNDSRLGCLSEIGAMAFAQTLAGISFPPNVLDVLLVYGYQPEAACALYTEICTLSAKEEEKLEASY